MPGVYGVGRTKCSAAGKRTVTLMISIKIAKTIGALVENQVSLVIFFLKSVNDVLRICLR